MVDVDEDRRQLSAALAQCEQERVDAVDALEAETARHQKLLDGLVRVFGTSDLTELALRYGASEEPRPRLRVLHERDVQELGLVGLRVLPGGKRENGGAA